MSDQIHLPHVSKFLFRGFRKYVHRLVGKRFHTLRVARGTIPTIPRDRSLLVFLNHPGWWDPIVIVLANHLFFAPRTFYAPMDADALRKYGVLSKLGFFGLDLSSATGAKQFLQVAGSILARSDTTLMMTPEGRFVDVREQSEFMPGLAHLAKTTNALLVPLAIEYTFWTESNPEALLQFGPPIDAAAHGNRSKDTWNDLLQTSLRETQASLAEKVTNRDEAQFETIVGGRTGEGGLYDVVRRLRVWLRGKRFDSRHTAISHAGK